jgi:hypothetical protein
MPHLNWKVLVDFSKKCMAAISISGLYSGLVLENWIRSKMPYDFQ